MLARRELSSGSAWMYISYYFPHTHNRPSVFYFSSFNEFFFSFGGCPPSALKNFRPAEATSREKEKEMDV